MGGATVYIGEWGRLNLTVDGEAHVGISWIAFSIFLIDFLILSIVFLGGATTR